MNPNVKYGLQLIMMCPCRFINCNKCTALAGDFESGRVYAYVKAGGTRVTSVASIHLCCYPKTALKNKVYFLKKQNPKVKI